MKDTISSIEDVVSVNRRFLLLAKNASKGTTGSLMTGLPTAVLAKIGSMSMDQIDSLASELPASAFTLRFNEPELERMLSRAKPSNTPQYALSLLSMR